MDKKDICFVELGDGSCFKSLQAVISKGVPGFDEAAKALAGASLVVKGRLIESPKAGQPFAPIRNSSCWLTCCTLSVRLR